MTLRNARCNDKDQQPDISVDEIYHFRALIILMGHDVWDTMKDYWSTSKLQCTPFYSKVMNCDQFMHVMEVLHFENNQDPRDRTNPDYYRSRKMR